MSKAIRGITKAKEIITDDCPICETICRRIHCDKSTYRITCDRCGEYILDKENEGQIKTRIEHFLKKNIWKYGDPRGKQLCKRRRMIASSIVSESVKGRLITDRDFERMFNTRDIPVTEKANKLLKTLGHQCYYIGEVLEVGLDDYELHAKCWILDGNELLEFLSYLHEVGVIRLDGHGGADRKVKITPNGWKYIEESQKPNNDSVQGFIAMWFNDSMNDLHDAIGDAIETAGYKPQRIDEKHHANKIDDEIIKEIRRSKFMVADLTAKEPESARGSVYYEAGFAHALGLQVILTAQKDMMPHFDIDHYIRITWKEDNFDEFKKELTNRIEALFGKGSYRKQSR